MKRILVVEDDAIISRVYQFLFPRAGLQLEVAADGEQALKMLETCQPDLVVVDLMLPKVHGVEVIKYIRAHPRCANVPVIVFTNAYLSTMVKAAWRAGANECLTKAEYSPEQLIQVIRSMLEKGEEARPTQEAGAAPTQAAPTAVEPAANVRTPVPVRAAVEPPPPPPPAAPPPAAPSPPAPAVAVARVRQPASVVSAPAAAVPRPGPQVGAGQLAVAPPGPVASPGPQARPGVIRVKVAAAAAPAMQEAPPAAAVVAPAKLAVEPPAGPVSARVVAPVAVFEPAAEAAPGPVSAAGMAGIEGGAGATLATQIVRKMLGSLPQLMVSLRSGMASRDPRQGQSQVMPVLLGCYELLHPLAGQASLAGLAPSLAGLAQIARLTGALEALLKELFEDQESLTGSALRTVGHGIESVVQLLRSWSESQSRPAPAALVLAVDDEVISRRAVQAALELADLKAVTADDPAFALRLLAENAFDLIFLDVEMPGMDGYELCSRLRAMARHQITPVVFVTSLSDFDHRVRSTASGGNDFIAKPFLPAELAVKALTYVLRGPARGARDQRKPF